MNYYLNTLCQYAVFNGRTGRKEFWMFMLTHIAIMIILSIFGSEPVSSIYGLATLIPQLAVGVRRIHDVNKNGWFILVPIYNIVLYCSAGTKGDNRFGSEPK